jgi:hypothetical protein
MGEQALQVVQINAEGENRTYRDVQINAQERMDLKCCAEKCTVGGEELLSVQVDDRGGYELLSTDLRRAGQRKTEATGCTRKRTVEEVNH